MVRGTEPLMLVREHHLCDAGHPLNADEIEDRRRDPFRIVHHIFIPHPVAPAGVLLLDRGYRMCRVVPVPGQRQHDITR